MDSSLQTKKLRPEWVDKLAEALAEEYDIGTFYADDYDKAPIEALADFIWQEYQKLMDEYIK